MTGTADRLREIARDVYLATPDTFVAERDRRAAEARSGGHGELARAVAGLRKPTLPAWAVDQVVLREPDEVAALWDAGDAARAALEGRGDGSLRDAMGRVRSVVAGLRDRAAAHLEGIGAAVQPHLDDIERTLTTAAVDPGRRDRVAEGTLTRPLEATGFGALGGLDVASGAAPADEQARRRRLADERRRLETRMRELDERHRETRERAEGLRRRAAAASAEAQELERERAAVGSRLAEVESQLG